MRQLVKPGAPKGDSTARSRRPAVGAPKAKEKPAAHRRLCFAAVLAVTFFLYYRFSLLDDAGARAGAGQADPCQGRYVYVYKLPPRFNADMVRDACRDTRERVLCASVGNAGLGRPLADSKDGVLTGENGWHGTRQLALDVIFHNRMLLYECLANRTTVAAAIYVPFYASLDIARHAADRGNATRDAATVDIVEWLKWRPEWNRRADGADHFLVAGRTARDLMRDAGGGPDWGTNLILTPVGRNMSVLVVESSARGAASGPAVPYPTYFHPRTDADVFRWQDRVRGLQRKWLMAFVGGEARPAAPDSPTTISDHVMAQCKASGACGHLHPGRCAAGSTSQCHSPVNVMRLLQNATFCLHPPPSSSSYTRRWMFDSMVAGCIPVFFHPASARLQYTWHLPRDHTTYSVFVPEVGVLAGTVSVEAALRAIPEATVALMREEVVRLIPRVVYADPRAKLETVKDAFDVAVEGILDRVARLRA